MSRCAPSLMLTSSSLLGASACAALSRPVAYSATAMPVMVDSRISGKALLVPVDRPAIGMSRHSRTTARWVPSPPSTTMAATPAARIRRAACEGVFDRRGRLHVEVLDHGPLLMLAVPARQVALQQRADATVVGHHQHPLDAQAVRRRQHAHDDVDAIGDLQVAGVGDDAADVARRDGIGDQADGGHAAPHCISRAEVRLRTRQSKGLRSGRSGLRRPQIAVTGRVHHAGAGSAGAFVLHRDVTGVSGFIDDVTPVSPVHDAGPASDCWFGDTMPKRCMRRYNVMRDRPS